MEKNTNDPFSNSNSGFDFSIEEANSIFNATNSYWDEETARNFLNKYNNPSVILTKVKSSFSNGISNSQEELNLRKKKFGENTNRVNSLPSIWFYIKESLEDSFLRILILCSVFQMIIGASPMSENPQKDWLDGLAILLAVIVIVLTTSFTNYSKEKKFIEIKNKNKPKEYIAIRDGEESTITENQIVVGDIIKLSSRIVIPADGLFISGEGLSVDESSLTGETKSIKKGTIEQSEKSINEYRNITKNKLISPLLWSGSSVISGSGWMVVLAVGGNSFSGKTTKIVEQSINEEPSPLEIKLEKIAKDIGIFGLIAALFTFLALLTKLLYAKWLLYEHLQMNPYIKTGNNPIEANSTLNYYNNSNSYNNSSSDFYKNITNLNNTVVNNPESVWAGISYEIFSILVLCITVIVVALPEGLPLAVTLSLSFSVKKMMNDNNLVRKLHACETMGGAHFICTDKTGTLTCNTLKVKNFHSINFDVDFEKLITNPSKQSQLKQLEEFNLIFQSLIYNSTINVNKTKNQLKYEDCPNKTDFSFYEMLRELKIFEENHWVDNFEIIRRKDFSHDTKTMSTIVRNKQTGEYNIFTKGAPEYIIKSCDQFYQFNSNNLYTTAEKKTLSDLDKKEYFKLLQSLSLKLQRTIAVSYKNLTQEEAEKLISNQSNKKSDDLNNFNLLRKSSNLSKDEALNHFNKFEMGHTLLGMFSISDSLRPGVQESVNDLSQAGIRVIMITGDNLETAAAIAKQANIKTEDFLVLSGEEFYNRIGGMHCSKCSNSIEEGCKCSLNLEINSQNSHTSQNDYKTNSSNCKINNIKEFEQIIKSLSVIGRATPMHKFALVLGLKQLNHVVSVTGDGTNDAMALSKADVGFAMGLSGTEVAREAADIILLDDNFNSIVHAVKWGRNIYDNIRKFLQFQLTVNISATLLVFFSSCVGDESPICAIQMLWINLIMDSLGSLSLATQTPTENLLKRKPHDKQEYIISRRMWKHIITQSLFGFILIFLLYLYAQEFIVENDLNRIHITSQIENCFGKFPGEMIKYENRNIVYYILDGKKSSWSSLREIKNNLDPSYCMFSNFEVEVNNLQQVFKWYNSNYGATVHMTIIFNSFVFFTLFNQLNSRILDDSLNILNRIGDNLFFLVIFLLEVLSQVLIVQYGGLFI